MGERAGSTADPRASARTWSGASATGRWPWWRGRRSPVYRQNLAVAETKRILRSTGRFVALSCLLLAAGSVLLMSTPGGPAGVPAMVATGIVAGAALVAGVLWWVRGWPREGVSIAFVLGAEIGHGVVLLSCADPAVSLLAATWFFLIGDYIAFAHGRRALVAHCVWVKANLLFYGVRALLEPGADVAFVGFLVVGLTATLIVTRLFGQVFSDALRSDSARSAELAHRDPLTQLLNRRGLDAAAPRVFAQARAENAVTAVFLVDIDRFKSVNDDHGHDAGDAVLALLARRLDGSVRKYGLVARTGGEEFVVLDVVHADGIPAMAERLRAVCDEPGDPVPVTVSVGAVGLAGDDFPSTDASELLTHLIIRADTAMYAAKQRGGNRVEVDLLRTDALRRTDGGSSLAKGPGEIFDGVMAARLGTARRPPASPQSG